PSRRDTTSVLCFGSDRGVAMARAIAIGSIIVALVGAIASVSIWAFSNWRFDKQIAAYRQRASEINLTVNGFFDLGNEPDASELARRIARDVASLAAPEKADGTPGQPDADIVESLRENTSLLEAEVRLLQRKNENNEVKLAGLMDVL